MMVILNLDQVPPFTRSQPDMDIFLYNILHLLLQLDGEE